MPLSITKCLGLVSLPQSLCVLSCGVETAMACLTVDPSILLMIVGVLMFLITFCGCVGSLRENICLLQTVSNGSEENRDITKAKLAQKRYQQLSIKLPVHQLRRRFEASRGKRVAFLLMGLKPWWPSG